AGLGDLHNSKNKHGRLDLGRTPGKFDGDVYAALGKPVARDADQFGGDDAAIEIARVLEPGIFRHRKYPTHLAAALLGVDQVGHADHLESALDHPIAAGESGVEHAVLHVARHLLRANQHAFDLGIIGRSKV